MTIARRVFSAGLAAAAALVAASLPDSARAAVWYFYIQYSSSSAITRVEVKEKGGSWGSFNLSGGIAPGRKVRLDWYSSTNDQDCKQSIRATFADGSVSDPTMIDFCSDLDTPIVFTD